jgi:lipooligosaccharide transport system ATP-binding protein
MIEARGLHKSFGDLKAVDDVSFEVGRGECLGFLGPNGAGKTTTIKMLSGQAPMDAGSVTVGGYDVSRTPRAVKQMLGICPQEDNLDTDFSVAQNMQLYASYFGIKKRELAGRLEELLRFVQLWERRGSDIRSLSGGMKRRLLLARSLVNEPEVLVLDEPTTGLDPQARHQVWSVIDDLKNGGTTILLTTHYMDEAERLCDQLLIMDWGKIISEGTPGALIEQTVGHDVVEAWGDSDMLPGIAEGFEGEWEQVARRIYLYPGSREKVRELMNRAESTAGVERVLHRPASLEDVFLRLTGRELRE